MGASSVAALSSLALAMPSPGHPVFLGGVNHRLDASIPDLGDVEKHQALTAPPGMGQTLEPQDGDQAGG